MLWLHLHCCSTPVRAAVGGCVQRQRPQRDAQAPHYCWYPAVWTGGGELSSNSRMHLSYSLRGVVQPPAYKDITSCPYMWGLCAYAPDIHFGLEKILVSGYRNILQHLALLSAWHRATVTAMLFFFVLTTQNTPCLWPHWVLLRQYKRCYPHTSSSALHSPCLLQPGVLSATGLPPLTLLLHKCWAKRA